MTAPGPGRGRVRGGGALVAGILAGILHFGPGFFILVSGLVAPFWAVLGMAAVWLTLFVLLFRLVEARSYWSLAIPVVTMAMWFAVISLGEQLLGWTA